MANVKTKSKPKVKARFKKVSFRQKYKKWLMPAAVIIVFGAIGVYYVAASQAATRYYISFVGGHNCRTTPTLRQGSRGECVKALQIMLNNTGANPRLTADGIFGPRTRSAVITYQRQNGLVDDGIVGNNTWHSLLNNCRAFYACTSVKGGKG